MQKPDNHKSTWSSPKSPSRTPQLLLEKTSGLSISSALQNFSQLKIAANGTGHDRPNLENGLSGETILPTDEIYPDELKNNRNYKLWDSTMGTRSYLVFDPKSTDLHSYLTSPERQKAFFSLNGEPTLSLPIIKSITTSPDINHDINLGAILGHLARTDNDCSKHIPACTSNDKQRIIYPIGLYCSETQAERLRKTKNKINTFLQFASNYMESHTIEIETCTKPSMDAPVYVPGKICDEEEKQLLLFLNAIIQYQHQNKKSLESIFLPNNCKKSGGTIITPFCENDHLESLLTLINLDSNLIKMILAITKEEEVNTRTYEFKSHHYNCRDHNTPFVLPRNAVIKKNGCCEKIGRFCEYSYTVLCGFFPPCPKFSLGASDKQADEAANELMSRYHEL